MPASRPSSPRNRSGRRWTAFGGIFFDAFAPDSAWIRECGWVRLPPLPEVKRLRIRGEFRRHPEAGEGPLPGLECRLNGRTAHTLRATEAGPWEFTLDVPGATNGNGPHLEFILRGVGWTNFLAWLGRVTGAARWQRFRGQACNRQLRLFRIETEDGEAIYDFSFRHSPYSAAFARRHLKPGLNIVGFLTADLGVGESARCMVRAADAADLPSALVQLKLPCLNRQGDMTYAARLQDANPYDVNVIHVDPPSASEIDRAHGPAFRAGRRNIAYWAWELPDFPDAWLSAFDFFQEVWCPSHFTREAILAKSPIPVLTMPHAISFPRPEGDARGRLGLPPDAFLFLFVFDLNSYAARKNPAAVLEAFRRSGLAGHGAALVIKVQNADGNRSEFARLQAAVADLRGTVLIEGTLSRADLYALQASCDCFVSLHRAEGFGLAVAECMYLGKPVIATDWSATAEYLSAENGCPVRCRVVPLTENFGPYAKGSHWAEADIDHAAEWMQRLCADRDLAGRLGAAARQTIETRFAPAAIGAAYRRRLETIAWF